MDKSQATNIADDKIKRNRLVSIKFNTDQDGFFCNMLIRLSQFSTPDEFIFRVEIKLYFLKDARISKKKIFLFSLNADIQPIGNFHFFY